MHFTYVALHEVTWYMVVWCTQKLHRDGCSFIKLVTHVEPHASAVSMLKGAENSAIQAIINHSVNI